MVTHLRATERHLPCGITQHKCTCPALTAAMQAGTRFTYPGELEGLVDFGDGYHLIATRPGVELTTS